MCKLIWDSDVYLLGLLELMLGFSGFEQRLTMVYKVVVTECPDHSFLKYEYSCFV